MASLKRWTCKPDVRNAVWSPSSDRLLVVTEPMNDLSDLGPAGQAFVVDAENADKPQKLDAIPPTVGNIAFAPDESAIVFSAATKEDAPPGYDELYALPKESSGAKVIPLSSGFAGQLGFGPLYFLADGTVIAQAGIGTHATPVRLTLDGSKPPEPIDLGAPVVFGLNTNRKKTGWVWMAESGGEPEKLCYARAPGRCVHGAADAGAGAEGAVGRGAGAGAVDERGVHGGGIAAICRRRRRYGQSSADCGCAWRAVRRV